MTRIEKQSKRNFLQEYPVADKIEQPRSTMKKIIIWLFTAVLFVANLMILVLFLATYAVRRILQFCHLVSIRSQGEQVEIRPLRHLEGRPLQVCVIGCGASGLVAVKECIENGLEVEAFDKDNEVGGVFATSYTHGRLTSSNIFTAFSSFPCGAEDMPSRFWSFKEYQDYLKRFVAHFKLERHLKFGHKVEQVKEMGDGKWEVTVSACATAQRKTLIYDHVIVCTGVNQEPETPEQLCNSKFRGQIIHSSEYQSPKSLAGKRVLILGLGESGSDIAFQVSQEAANVCIITRRGPGTVIPRFFAGVPNDTDTNRLYHGLPRSLFRNRITWWKIKTWLERFYSIKEDEELHKALQSLTFSRYHWMSKFGTKTTSFVWAVVQNGGRYMETSVRELDEDGAIMENGSRYDCDAIIYCSGFKRCFPFLPPELQNLNFRNDLWKKTIHPRFGKRIAFIGFARPSVGAIPPISEMMARFVALALAGRVDLPSEEDMKKTMADERSYEEWNFEYDYKRLSSLCSYLETMVGWAQVLGCEVCYRRLIFTDPYLFFRVLFGPILTSQFRLFGEGADYKKSRNALMLANRSPLAVILYTSMLVLSSAILSNLGLCEPPVSFHLL